jgi:hypothetical protein
MFPHLSLGNNDSLPRGAKDLGHGYALLRACQNTARAVTDAEANAILRHWEEKGWPNMNAWPRAVKRWACLWLPNGQQACSKWHESHSTCSLRKTTCVKVFNRALLFLFHIYYSLNRWLWTEHSRLPKLNISSSCSLGI